METIFDRTKLLIGEDNLNKIKNSKICVFGVGGVGGYAVECLARAGVGELTLVDFDKINVTNINRQIIALNSNIGAYKVDEYKKRIFDINPQIQVNEIKVKLTPDNLDDFNLGEYDYIIDAIDDVKAKVSLCVYASVNKINIISAMGSGNKFSIPNFCVVDIFKTEGDKLARKMRQELKQRGIKKLDCVFSKGEVIEHENKAIIASISYYPAAAGVTIASFVINKIIGDKNA